MRILPTILLSLLSGIVAYAATVTGSVKHANGQPFTGVVRFSPLNTPLADPPDLVISTEIAVTNDTVGSFAVVLRAGHYRVSTPVTGPWVIEVPSGTNTYSVIDLVVQGLGIPADYVPDPGGSLAPTASAVVQGKVRTDTSVADPVVYLKESVDAILANRPHWVPTVASLKVMPIESLGLVSGDMVFVLGRDTPDDGAGGLLRYSPGAVYHADDGYVYAGISGQYVRDFFQPANPLWWGAKGDYDFATDTGTDNTAALQAMLDSPYVLGGTNQTYAMHRPIVIPKGNYKTGALRCFNTNNLTGDGNYSRGGVRMEGAGGNATIFWGTGSSNILTFLNGRHDLKHFMINATPARRAATPDAYQGCGIHWTDIDGLGAELEMQDVPIWYQPGFAFQTTGAVEQARFGRSLYSYNRLGGVHMYASSFSGAAGYGLYEAAFHGLRIVRNGGPAVTATGAIQISFYDCEALANCSKDYNGLGYKTEFIEWKMTSPVGCSWYNHDTEDWEETIAVKLPPSTNVVFAANLITDPTVNFVTAGFTTNMLVVVSGCRPQQGLASLDGVYLITGVTSNTLTVEHTFAPLATFSPPTTMPITLHGSRANVGFDIYLGRQNRIFGGRGGSLSVGAILRGARNNLIDAVTANYTETKTGLIHIWDTSDTSFSYGNVIRTIDPAGIDTNNVFAMWYPRYSDARNVVWVGSRLNILTAGGTNNGIAIDVTGGASGSPLIKMTREAYDPLGFGVTGVDQVGVYNYTDQRYKMMLGGDAASHSLRFGAAGAYSTALPGYIQGEQPASSAANTAGGGLVYTAGEGRGTGTPSTHTFRAPLVGAAGTTLQTLQTLAILGTHTTTDQTGCFIYWYNGSGWSSGWIKLGAAGTGPGGSGRALYIP